MTEIETQDIQEKKSRQKRKKVEVALILPIIGVIMLLTPLLKVFTQTNGDTPLTNTVMYIFGIWAALIIAAFILARMLINEIRD